MAIAIFDIDGVVRDVGGSYRRALADTVAAFTQESNRPSPAQIDALKGEGRWNNDWQASQELIFRYFEGQGRSRPSLEGDGSLAYETIVDYFQRRYRGPILEDPEQWSGYICQEPLLMGKPYLESLTAASMPWGFVSGATPASAAYVLERRLGLIAPPLIAMGEAPDKPDPTGLIAMADRLDPSALQPSPAQPVLYAGDTVADMYTVVNARTTRPDRRWIAVGVLPPHVQGDPEVAAAYSETLRQAGADWVTDRVTNLTPDQIRGLLI
jgi:HAD superfamily phosphatase